MMVIEVCNLCHKIVNAMNKTTVIIKDYKGIEFDLNGVYPAKRKFEGVICDDCLKRLRDGAEKEE